MLNELYVYTFLPREGWVPCGILIYQEQGRYSSSTFRYGTEYLDRSRSYAIDPVQLPLASRQFDTPEGFSVFNGIRDAGPDKWGRYLLDKKFQRSLNEIEYIAATGSNRVGALAFGPSPSSGPKVFDLSGFVKKEDSAPSKLEDSLEAAESLLKNEDSKKLQQYLQYGPSLGGARPKVATTFNKKPCIAKFSVSLDTRNESAIEYATMTLAKKCGLDVPKVYLHKVLNRDVYIIERFDRKKDNQNPIPFASGLTLTGLHESDYSSWSYHGLVDAIIKFSPDPEKDLLELFKRMLFNILVYNNDDHLRNFGFLHKEKDFWALSPLYDVLPSTITGESYSLAMQVGVEGKKASLANARSQADRFRISADRAKKICHEMLEVVSTWKEHYAKSGVSQEDIKKLENSFKFKN